MHGIGGVDESRRHADGGRDAMPDLPEIGLALHGQPAIKAAQDRVLLEVPLRRVDARPRANGASSEAKSLSQMPELRCSPAAWRVLVLRARGGALKQRCCPVCGTLWVKRKGRWVLEILNSGGVQVTQKTSARKIAAILDLRDEGLTQCEIAERLGVCQFVVSRAEHKAGMPRRKKRGSFSDSATGLNSKSLRNNR